MHIIPTSDTVGAATYYIPPELIFESYSTKDYTVALTWIRAEHSRTPEPCMVIRNARPGSHDSGMYAIGLRQITRYCDEHMKPTPYAFAEAVEALPVLGRAILKTEVFGLIDTILAHTDDLVMMPVAPPSVRRQLATAPVWEVEQREKDGKTLREATV